MADYVTALPYWLLSAPNSLPERRAISVIFGNNDLLRFHSILLFFTQAKMCLLRSKTANLCQIMSHFNVLNFSEWRSEEVISLF